MAGNTSLRQVDFDENSVGPDFPIDLLKIAGLAKVCFGVYVDGCWCGHGYGCGCGCGCCRHNSVGLDSLVELLKISRLAKKCSGVFVRERKSVLVGVDVDILAGIE